MNQYGIGQPVRRVEDQRFLTGRGSYIDDLARPRQAYAYLLRSPHAHAQIRALDTAAAAAVPGALAVLTGEDLARDGLGPIPCLGTVTNRDGSVSAAPPRAAMVRDRVRHVGDTVAMVVAETLAAARDAAELIEVDYETLPAAVETAPALGPGQPQVWDDMPGNLAFDWGAGDLAAVERAMAGARHRIGLELVNNRIVVNSMEPRGAIGEYASGEDAYTLWSTTQGSHLLRYQLAESIFRVPENRIRVVTPDVGGGFGMKAFLYPEHILVLWAAKKLGRPVKWTPERSDAFMTDTHGRDNVTRLELALDDELRFLGLRVTTIANMGAYLSNFAPEIPTNSGGVMFSGVYAIPAIHVEVKGVFTHTVPVDAYRGAGRPEAAYAIERLIDLAASRLGVAPKELRRRNFIKPEAMPYATPLGLTYDSGDFARNMEDALAAADVAGFARRRDEARRRGRWRGLATCRLYRAVGDAPRRIRRIALRPEWHLDDPDGDAVFRTGASDRLCPARGRAVGAGARSDPGTAGRYRGDRLWPRHRRLALIAGRRRLARPCRRKIDREGPADRRAPAGGGGG